MTLSQLLRTALAFSCLPFAALAQSSTPDGTVTGVVSNAKTGGALEGAQVTLSTTGQQPMTAVSQRGGSFEFTHVPAGPHTLQVSYTGLDAYSSQVQVTAGQIETVKVPLTSEVYKLEAFSVAGVREGNAAAITEQHNAPNIVSVLSTDAYGDVADGNIAIMIQNEPGVDVFQQSGDDTGISVGGVPVELTSTNINGVRMASAIVGSTGGLGDRSQLADRIPADFVQKIQITIGNTPDEMADSLAGSINLVTKSGFDVIDPLFEYRVGVTGNDYFKFLNHHYRGTGAAGWQGALDKQRKFALAISASYSDTLNPSQNINTGHSFTDARATGARMLSDLNERLRDGVSGQLDYKSVDNGIHAWVNGMVDYYAFTNQRNNWQASASSTATADYSVVSLAQIQAGAAPKTTAGAAAGIAPGFDPNQQTLILNPNITNDAEHEDRRGHQYIVAGGISKEWNDSKWTVQASWNPTSFDDDFYGMTVNYNAMPVGIFVDETHDAMRPVYSQAYGPSLSAGQTNYSSSSWFAQWFKQPDIERQTVSDVKSDFEQKAVLAGVTNNFKAGIEYRDENDWFINTYRPFWNFNGSLANAMPQILEAPSSSMSVFNNSMPSFTWDTIDFNKAKALFLQNPGQWTPMGATVSAHPIPHDLAEFVNAAYVQDTIQLGKLNILGGVRFEHTSVEGVGSYSDPNLPNVTQSHFNSAYQDFFPSLHLKYDFDKHLVFKGSYTTSSARPAYSSVVPNVTVSNVATATGQPGSVTLGNPALKPDYGRSLVGAVEYYFNPSGLLSFTYFYRKISDFQVTETSVLGSGANNGFNGLYSGYLLSTSANLNDAYAQGYQIDYKQQLVFLPKPFNGISLFANTTQQRTHGVFPSGATQLPFFVPRTSNVGVVYDYAKFEGRFTWHDHSYYLQSYSATPASNTYVADIPEEDVSFSYQFSPHYTIFLDIVNIRDMDYVQYNINMYTRNTELQDNGRRFNFGVSGRF